MTSAPPLAIDLYCGLGGWSEGLMSEGWDVVGFDIERHEYEGRGFPRGRLVLQDVLTLHGSQFARAALIVASPPCQAYSYMAMPWARARAAADAIRADESGAKLEQLNRLFDAPFRIRREASEAAGRDIPLVVENVRGAQTWVGPAAWNYGPYYLWGDVPALMPRALKADFKGSGAGAAWFDQNLSRLPSGSPRRRAASAKIAKIPFALSSHIARVYQPRPSR